MMTPGMPTGGMNVLQGTPMLPTGPQMLQQPQLIQQAAMNRVGFMNSALQQPNALQSVLRSGGEILKTALPVAGVLLLTWVGIKMILGQPPKILSGK